MFQILHGLNVDWMRRRHIAYIVSGLSILASIISLVMHGGPRYGVDFTGGTLIEVSIQPAPSVDDVRHSIDQAGFKGAEIQRLERPDLLLIRMQVQEGRPSPAPAVKQALLAAHPGSTVDVRRVENVGPRVGGELRAAAVKAVFLALGMILVYVAIRYDWRYSMGAVAALFHDVFITLGAVSIFNKEVTLTVVAALLTIAGFSINDTIVVFDRIRERRQALRREPPEKVMNIAINETLSRTIITSFTVVLTVLALFFLGGEVLHDFSFAMLVGVVYGTYSSVYVASALALETQLALERRTPARKR
ncbi:MAG TPA: protein translocase subunit SecF [Candidatus Eisenbacteria bacterium]|nr:protein translocase subunit SecF [Candidatus Eisenbacteria bacterium]